MEIPRVWREQSSRIRFDGREKTSDKTDMRSYKYPGGEIPLHGDYYQIRDRFEKKGFSAETTDEILFRLWSGVAPEASISLTEVADSFFEFIGSEVGK